MVSAFCESCGFDIDFSGNGSESETPASLLRALSDKEQRLLLCVGALEEHFRKGTRGSTGFCFSDSVQPHPDSRPWSRSTSLEEGPFYRRDTELNEVLGENAWHARMVRDTARCCACFLEIIVSGKL